MSFLITGWKNIAHYCGVSVRTAKRYHYKYGMPVLRWPGERPVIIPAVVQRWLVIFNDLTQKRHRNDTPD